MHQRPVEMGLIRVKGALGASPVRKSALRTEVSRWQGGSLAPGFPFAPDEGAWPKAPSRAFTSYRIGKEHPHDPDILSLRHDCPTLAGFSGKWSLLDGRSAIATGWFPSLSDRVRGPSHPPGGCSVTRPPTCRVTRPRAWSQASILNRFASSLAGG